MTARYDHHGDTVAHTLSGQLDYVMLIERCRVQAVLPARPWLYDWLDRAIHLVRARTSERTRELAPERSLRPIPPSGANERRRDLHIAGHHADGRDSTPSLSVNLEMGSSVWFCHAGNIGGDSLSLVQHMEGLASPKEALAFAKERWPLPEVGRDERAR